MTTYTPEHRLSRGLELETAIEPDGSLTHVILNDSNLTGPFYRDHVG